MRLDYWNPSQLFKHSGSPLIYWKWTSNKLKAETESWPGDRHTNKRQKKVMPEKGSKHQHTSQLQKTFASSKKVPLGITTWSLQDSPIYSIKFPCWGYQKKTYLIKNNQPTNFTDTSRTFWRLIACQLHSLHIFLQRQSMHLPTERCMAPDHHFRGPRGAVATIQELHSVCRQCPAFFVFSWLLGIIFAKVECQLMQLATFRWKIPFFFWNDKNYPAEV